MRWKEDDTLVAQASSSPRDVRLQPPHLKRVTVKHEEVVRIVRVVKSIRVVKSVRVVIIIRVVRTTRNVKFIRIVRLINP